MLTPCAAPNFGAGCLWADGAAAILTIPAEWRDALAPALICLTEWTDYRLYYPGADRLRLGDTWLKPIVDSLFLLRFENRLGLAALQPFTGRRALCPPLHVEVISPKFPTPAAHVIFLRVLLDDLCSRAARLPFVFSAPTGRGVVEALEPPTPLFTLHFFCQHAPLLRAALALLQEMPHRELRDDAALVPLAAATEADADVLLGILQSPDEWTRAAGFPLARRLRGQAPRHVRQRRPAESFDTPENRFMLTFLRELLAAAEALPAQAWWRRVSIERRALVREAAALLRHSIAHPPFAGLGPPRRLPAASRLLWQREGYRDLFLLWRLFQQASKPLFARLQRAIDLRDVATLYEVWSFFALVEAIAALLQQAPSIELRLADATGLRWRSEAGFGAAGKLVYNLTLTEQSYSVPLRPDFLWLRDGRPAVALDAKFRLERQFLEESSDDDTPLVTARRTDLYKMHTYRDALGVRAAVSLYPGDTSIFYGSAGPAQDVTLRDVLLGDLSGIGALAMRPVGSYSSLQFPVTFDQTLAVSF